MDKHALFREVRIYFGFSRTTHGFIDIAQPALGAVIALGVFPELRIIIIGLVAAFAGYTAVFALNDLIDYKVDIRRMQYHRKKDKSFDVDSLGIRHPLAQGYLTYRQGLAWIIFWASVAVAGAYVLNPVSALLFALAGGLELTYCKLLRVTAWKVFLTGAMVAVGALAGMYAVVPHPNLSLVIVFFVWMFAWEIGGRNIPNDWSDIEEDPLLGIKTVPVVYGLKTAGVMTHSFLWLVLISSLVIAFLPGVNVGPLFVAGALIEGLYALIIPSLRLMKNPKPQNAFSLFNRACFYPAVMFAILGLSIYLPYKV